MLEWNRFPVVLNKEQAKCLADLFEGKLRGTTLKDIDPPKALGVISVGNPFEHRPAEYIDEEANDGTVTTREWMPEHLAGEKSVSVMDDKGRVFDIAVEGSTWPPPDSDTYKESRP